MKQIINVSVIISLFLLPGCCGNLVDVAKETFPQGEEYHDKKSVIKYYLHAVNVYDQFTTLGLFDALWLSDEVRTVYSDIYADMLGKDKDTKNAFLRRQLKANSHFISFYVLSTHEVSLSVRPIPWALYIDVDGKKYTPFEVKAIELSAQYRMIFGKRFNNHKQAYEVKFERNDANGNDILKEGLAHNMKLFFSGPVRYAYAEWNIGSSGKVVPISKKKSPSKPVHFKKTVKSSK